MSESDRVQHWRQRQREAGKKPLTIWLTDEEKLRLEDRALSRRCSPSELIQHMLAQWQGDSLSVTDTVTDMEQIRAIVQHELAQTHIGTATITDTVTATLQQTLPALVRALLDVQQAVIVTDSVTAIVTDTVTVADPTLEPFGTTKYRLGRLCSRNHDYHGTGQSLRKNSKAGGCLACDAEQARARRQAKRQEVSA